MPSNFNHERAIYYPASDLAAGCFAERVKLLLSDETYAESETINDAIEAHQCKLIIESHPYFFDADELPDLAIAVNQRFAQACKATARLLDEQPAVDVFESVESQYRTQFWDLLSCSGLWSKISESDMRALLLKHPYCLRNVLKIPGMVKRFDGVLCEAMPLVGRVFAELIVRELGVKGASKSRLVLPPSLQPADIDELMISYLAEEEPNLNYVNVLTKWPNDSRSVYNPSPEVVITATRRSEELNESLLGREVQVSHTIGAVFTAEQKACVGIEFADGRYIHTYGLEWLREFTDYGTILNNFIYVFGFMGTDGLLSLPAHDHENSTLIESFTMRSFGEYPVSMGFEFRQVQALIAVQGYENVLESEGLSIEQALDYAYNDYFGAELGVDGFSISLPSADSSWLDKCKAMGPEIERVIKAFMLFCDKGVIDDAYFPYVDVKRFDGTPSLIADKYVVPGPLFESRAAVLFSDQSLLAFLQAGDSDYQEFFHHIEYENVTRVDFYEHDRSLIDELLAEGLVLEGQDGVLRPTDKTRVLRALWEDGAVCAFRKSDSYKQLVAEMVEEELVSYAGGLFSPDEGAYLNYMFNNARFSNALALRNKYDHAGFRVDDPNADEYKQDYFRLLVVLLCVTLKVNDDLSFALGKGDVLDFVDWPWLDESISDFG